MMGSVYLCISPFMVEEKHKARSAAYEGFGMLRVVVAVCVVVGRTWL